MKKKCVSSLLALVLVSFGLSAQSVEELSVRRFGLYVASNDGGAGRTRLLYADDDVVTMSRTLGDLGGVSPEDEVTLYEPDVAELDAAIADMGRSVGAAGNARRTEVVFYYSGHSDEHGLMLGEDRYSYGRLKERLEALEADVLVAILDSCASGAFTRDKGGTRRAPFLIDDSSRMEGHAYLTSSSADEVSQESDAIGGSFFTHYLVSGLRGAADTTRDGRVTLNEIYQHTYAETLARTERTLGGPQHPAYDIRLTGTGDLVLTDLSRPTASMILAESMSGRIAVRDDTGRLVAEINKRPEEEVVMALPSGTYALTVQEDGSRHSGSVSLQRGAPTLVDSGDLSRVRPEYTQFRGEEADEQRPEFVASFGVTPSLSFPNASEATVNLQYGFPIASAWGMEGVQSGFILAMTEGGVEGVQHANIGARNRGPLSGAQLGGIFTETAGSVSGAQAAGIFARAGGPVSGAQVAGIFVAADDSLEGAQAAGFYSIARGSVVGCQVSGFLNVAEGPIIGAQISGFINRCEDIEGVQVGLVNVSDHSSGVLVGLVNYSKDMRAFPLGLLNISRSGILDFDYRWENGRQYFSVKTGNRYYYTRFIFGFEDWTFDRNGIVLGFGFGLRATLRPFYLEVDFDLRTALADYEMYPTTEEALDNILVLPTFSLTAGFGRRFGFYTGVGMTLKSPSMNRESVLLDGGARWNGSNGWAGVVKWYCGVHL